MTAQEFCYWLQGAFEIAGVKQLDAAQVRTIRNHLRLVAEIDPRHDNAFVEWLVLRHGSDVSVAAEDTAKIARMLAAQFRHVIDASYGVEAKKAQAIHDGPPSSRPIMRC